MEAIRVGSMGEAASELAFEGLVEALKKNKNLKKDIK